MTDRGEKQDEIEDKPLLALSLSAAKIWTLFGICISVLVGTFSLGSWIERTNSNSMSAKKEQEIRELKDKIEDAQRGVNALNDALKDTIYARRALDTKVELLNRLVGYFQGRDEVSKNLLINAVCSMWRESETRILKLNKEPVVLKIEDLRLGMRPEVELFLKSINIPPDILDIIRNPPPRGTINVGPILSRNIQPSEPQRVLEQASALVSKQASQVNVIKTVSFGDGTRYEMPQEIALAVHMKPTCAPQ